ncbi:alpha/beta hydrolase [Aeoliella sp. ICT_H6.2]|uniref:Alpha/beta hydrolase n=1 Tax=Aeoliella straminimaris TaxID=2954799 RepID=A0A9X2JGJ6_9BACT|nr:alpha/beta hydrolase [Aeoliella straminimaris]MCO6044457.1 alpha/beta hydrolase [Aeoliella straminimaris]
MPRVLFVATAIAVVSAAAISSAQLRLGQRAVADRVPDNVQLVADVPYAETDNRRQTLDLLVPKAESDKPRPVVAFIHGGAWRAGDKRQALWRVARYADSGDYVAVSIGYRLSDEAQWPAQMHDCKAAIRWLKANAEKYNIDPDKIGVWGTSAGGHLVAVLGTSAGVEAMDGTLGPHTDQTTSVACVADFFGPTDFLQMSKGALPGARLDHDSARSPESLLIGGAIHDHPEKVATANPITYVTEDDPPFLIIHGTADPTVPFNQSELINAALKETSVPTTLVAIEGGGHGQGFPPEANNLVRRFFDHHLRNQHSEWHDQSIEASEGPPRRRPR